VPSIGYRQYGIYKRLPDNALLVPKVLYETSGQFDKQIPNELAIGFLNDWKNEMQATHGIIATYLEVNGDKWTVQWYSPTEKSLIGTIVITAIVAVAVTVAFKFLAESLTNLAQETGELVTLLGPENLQMLLQIVMLIVVLSLMSPLINAVTGAFKRR